MGREIKRVPTDFGWPKDKIWEGYLNPHYDGHCSDCPDCRGRGSTTAMQRLEDLVSLLMLSADDAQRGKAHPYFAQAPLYNTSGLAVSKDIVELTSGLAGRPPSPPFGHDACDRWGATKAIIKAAGLRKSWGVCKRCKGEGSTWDTKENKLKAARWRSKEPPKGKGYQLWETVSEGSPISPVFETPEELADWLATSSDYKWASNDKGTTRDQWLKFIVGPGWCPSMIMDSTGVHTGVQAVS